MVAGRPMRGEVWLVHPGQARGSEIRAMRPCLVVSPDEINRHFDSVIVAPMTTGTHPYRFRVPCRFRRRDAHIVTDQLRTVDRERLVRRLGVLPAPTVRAVLAVLQEMFAP